MRSENQWIRSLPHSKMGYPTAFFDKIKYWFWVFYSRFYPMIRGISYRLGIGSFFIRHFEPGHTGRQDFLIGTLHPSHTAHELALFLVERGFGNHFVAWKDAGELVSLRKTVGFEHQYHLRIFKDGEVRCHFEYTPEYRPFLHMVRVGFENRNAEFRDLLQGWIVPIDDSEHSSS